ncbi:transglycosylase protein with SLT domain [Kineococcus xinjiangensis]|uniref:Transglycosylase protein with SLT domain n=1 Tax=Kineococcus xinjiangensis TaxID=512762 RepID=A0A2S6ICE5_9ACTN|nr:lytic transglycosylase domain-containing protein [Kineococcus xinjiangensis]PPK90903.1 transglycosylase protein with SLT domain [Kineococcus xinjiangensis]
MRTSAQHRTTTSAVASLLAAGVVLVAFLHVLLAAPAAATAAGGQVARQGAVETAAQAARAAAAAGERVDALGARLTELNEAARQQQEAVSSAVSATIRAETSATTARSTAENSRRAQGRRVRALYMAGGAAMAPSLQLELWRTAISGGDVLLAQRGQRLAVEDLLERDELAAAATATADAAADRASTDADEHAYEAIAGVRRLADAAEVLGTDLARAENELAALSSRARDLAAAEEAARRLAELKAAAEVATAEAAKGTGKVRARPVAADWASLYRDGAATCPGMRVSLLAAVGQVESGHGRNNGPSSAGAIGPMQFMPPTFAAYGVDGDGDGARDAWAPSDAVHSAANYLCANGGGKGRDAEARALYRYNRADWYVTMVQRIADEMDTTGVLVR